MNLKMTTTCAIGFAAALSMGAVSTVRAQTPDTTGASASSTDTTTTRRHIRVSKDNGLTSTTSPGAIAPSDTARSDTTGFGTPSDTRTGMAAPMDTTTSTDTTLQTDTTSVDTTAAPGAVVAPPTDTTGMPADTMTRDTTNNFPTGAQQDTARINTGPNPTDTLRTGDTTTVQSDTTTMPTTPSDTSSMGTPGADTTSMNPSANAGGEVSADTVGGMESPVSRRFGALGNGFYIGVAGGATFPTRDLNTFYNTGWTVNVPIGWESQTVPLGVRVNLAYDRLNGADVSNGSFAGSLDNTDVWSGSLDLTAKLPFGLNGSGLYVVGGGGAYHFRDFSGATSTTVFPDGSVTLSPTTNSTTKFGLDGGVGLDFGWGPAKLYVEGRWVSVFTPGKNANWIPVVLGLKF